MDPPSNYSEAYSLDGRGRYKTASHYEPEHSHPQSQQRVPFRVVIRCRRINDREEKQGMVRYAHRENTNYKSTFVVPPPYSSASSLSPSRSVSAHHFSHVVGMIDPDITLPLSLTVHNLQPSPHSNRHGENGNDLPNVVSIPSRFDKQYVFNTIYNEHATNAQVYYDSIQPLVESVVKGYNATCFTYGATGSGKTFTMTGDFEARRKGINPTRNVVHWTDSSPSFVQSSENSWGIFHYAVNDLFNASKRGVDDGTPARCSIIVSYLEIYNERIIDLLAGEPISACGVAKRGDREGSVNGVVVKSAMVSNINNQTSNSVLSNTRRRNSSASSGNSSLSSAQGRNISVYDFRGNSSADKSTSLDIAEDPKTGQTYVVGLSEVEIHNVEQLNDLLEEGTRRRTKASTASNVASSRSHAILQLTYREERGVFQESCDNAHDYKPSSASPAHRTRGVCHNEENGDITSTGSPSILWGRLSLIDLAGSEREHYIIPSSGSQRSKRRTQQQEGANINKSLLALGNCITTLGQQSARIMASQQSAVLTGSNSHESAAGSIHNTNNKTGSQSRQRQVSSSIAALQQHIPYRDSKLTRLLKDSLGGNTQTLMIATISPACITHEETLSTLKYATRAKAITQSVEKNLLTGAQAIKELHAAKEKRRKLKLENEEKERAEKLALQEREEEKKCLNELKMYNQQKLRQKEQEIRQNKVHCGRERKRAYEEDSDQFTVIKDPSNLSVMSELNMHADTEKPNAMAGITVVGKWESYNNNDNSNKIYTSNIVSHREQDMKLSNANMIDLIRTDTIFSRGSGNSEAQQGCTNSSGQEVIESIAGDHSLANDVLRGLREKQACYIKGLTNNSQSITTSSCFSSDSTNANSPMWCSDYDKVNTLRSDVHLTNREERIRSNDDPSIKRPAVVIRDSLPFVSEGKPTSSTGPSPPIYPLYNTRIMEEIQQLENDVKRLNVELHSDTNSIEECDKWGYSVDVCLPSTENMGLSHGSHTDALKSVTTSNVDDFLQLSASHELSRQGSHNNPPATVEFTGHQSDIGPSSSHSGAEGLTKLPLPLETVQVPISTKDNDEGHHSYHQSHSNNNLGTQLNTCSVPILTAQLANQSSLSVSFPSTQLSSPSQSRSPSITYSPPSSNIKSLPLCVSKSPSVLPFSRDSINSERAALVDNMSSKGKSLSYQRNKAILGQCNGLLPAGPNSLSGSTLSGYSTSVSGSSTVDIINNRISRSSSYSKSYHQKTHPLWMASVDKYLHATGETVGTGLSSRGHGDETIPAANVTGDNLLRTSSVIGDDKFDKADCRKKASWRCDSLPPAYSFFVNDTPSSGASDTCMSNIHTTPNSSFVFPQKQFMDTRHITSSNETRDYREGYHPSLYQGRHTYDKENTNTNANVKVHRQDQQSDNDCKRILLYRSSNIENPITVNRANH